MMGETTIVFVGETKICLYKCTTQIGELWDVFKSKIPKGEDGSRIVDDSHWTEFYATLNPDQKKSVSLLNEVPVLVENIS